MPAKKNELSRLSAWPPTTKSSVKARQKKRPLSSESASPSVTQYFQTPPPLSKAVELPALYNETYLRVIPRDPDVLFAFWETSGGPDGTPFLRLYETEWGNSEKFIGYYAVEKGTCSRYIRVPAPGRRYRLEFGVGSPGRFKPMFSSCEVAVPAGCMREPQPLTKEAEILAGFSAGTLSAASSPHGTAAGL